MDFLISRRRSSLRIVPARPGAPSFRQQLPTRLLLLNRAHLRRALGTRYGVTQADTFAAFFYCRKPRPRARGFYLSPLMK